VHRANPAFLESRLSEAPTSREAVFDRISLQLSFPPLKQLRNLDFLACTSSFRRKLTQVKGRDCRLQFASIKSPLPVSRPASRILHRSVEALHPAASGTAPLRTAPTTQRRAHGPTTDICVSVSTLPHSEPPKKVSVMAGLKSDLQVRVLRGSVFVQI